MGTLFNKRTVKIKTNLLIPQYVPRGFYHHIFLLRLNLREKNMVLDGNLLEKFMENGGDGIYAAWKILPDEGPFKKL